MKTVKARIVRILPWGEWQTVVLECGHERKLRKAEVEREQLYIDKRVPCAQCTASDAARALVSRRWAKTTPAQRSEHASWLSAQRTPAGLHKPKRPDQPRCPCGTNTLHRAQKRAFECCKKAGVKVPPELRLRKKAQQA